jgi:hypothetical protein
MMQIDIYVEAPAPVEVVVESVNVPGKSAYELAVDDGFSGSLTDWLVSLHGEDAVLTALTIAAALGFPPADAAALAGKQDVLDFTPENAANKDQANGYAGLNDLGLINSVNLPSYIDEVRMYNTYADLPLAGETSIIYVTIDDNQQYRWSGLDYQPLSKGVVLGETEASAYRGDRGKIAFAHSQATGNPHGLTKNDLELGKVPNLSFSGSNTGDETETTILEKLGISTLSGENTGDQDLSGLATKASPRFSGGVHTQVVGTFAGILNVTSGVLTVDVSSGDVIVGALSASVTTWAFTNVPDVNSLVSTVTLRLTGSAAHTYGDACSVNGGASINGVKWSGGSVPTATNGVDTLTFVIYRDSAADIKVDGYAAGNWS